MRKPSPTPISPASKVRVWDRFVRTFHWSLVASCATAYAFTEKIDWRHKGAGYLALALVCARIAWGFLAPNRHARFADFVPGPTRLMAYLGALLRGKEPRHLGHNPAGALMILYLIAAVLTVSITGWLLTTDAYWGNETVETIHTGVVDLSLWMVGLHVIAAIVTGWRHRENLVVSMLTGMKRRDESAPAREPAPWP